ncbi:MAG: leucyl/phenylalanyl-tRNA--protein transferase [Gammaproteobacteria bacterium]
MSRVQRGPFIIPPDAPADCFPPVDQAMREPDGLLAIGGDLSPARLLAAYQRGIFPWYNDGEPVLWWSPHPRCVLIPGKVRVSRRLVRTLRQGRITVRLNTRFDDVVRGCAGPRGYTEQTWITSDMARAYGHMHQLGHAHSIEAYDGDTLVGGLYGLAIGRVFFGESMFSARRDASKIVLVTLSAWLEKHKFALIDCQVASSHLMSMGATLIPRVEFIRQLPPLCAAKTAPQVWERGRDLPGKVSNRALQ